MMALAAKYRHPEYASQIQYTAELRDLINERSPLQVEDAFGVNGRSFFNSVWIQWPFDLAIGRIGNQLHHAVSAVGW